MVNGRGGGTKKTVGSGPPNQSSGIILTTCEAWKNSSKTHWLRSDASDATERSTRVSVTFAVNLPRIQPVASAVPR